MTLRQALTSGKRFAKLGEFDATYEFDHSRKMLIRTHGKLSESWRGVECFTVDDVLSDLWEVL